MTFPTNDTGGAEAALRRMVAATNAEDRDAFIACFTDDASVDDNGRVFSGRGAIQRWSDGENIGAHIRLTIGATRHAIGGRLDAEVTASGDGYNGPGSLTVTARNGLIERLVIR